MTKKSDGNKFRNLMRVENFTKHAIEDFEQYIVNQKDYLEKVKENQSSENLK